MSVHVRHETSRSNVWVSAYHRVTIGIGFQVQAGPVGSYFPLEFNLFGGSAHFDDEGSDWWRARTTPTTNIIGSWTPVALPTTHIDVDDASAFEDGTTYTHNYVSIAIPGSARTLALYDSITIGGGAGGSDRINLNTSSGLGAGHRGIGTPAAGASVRQAYPEIHGKSNIAQEIEFFASFEAISGGVVGVRQRSADPSAFFTPGVGMVVPSANIAEQLIGFTYISSLKPRSTSTSTGGLFFEVLSDTAGGTAGQVRTDPAGFIAPIVKHIDYGRAIT